MNAKHDKRRIDWPDDDRRSKRSKEGPEPSESDNANQITDNESQSTEQDSRDPSEERMDNPVSDFNPAPSSGDERSPGSRTPSADTAVRDADCDAQQSFEVTSQYSSSPSETGSEGELEAVQSPLPESQGESRREYSAFFTYTGFQPSRTPLIRLDPPANALEATKYYLQFQGTVNYDYDRDKWYRDDILPKLNFALASCGMDEKKLETLITDTLDGKRIENFDWRSKSYTISLERFLEYCRNLPEDEAIQDEDNRNSCCARDVGFKCR